MSYSSRPYTTNTQQIVVTPDVVILPDISTSDISLSSSSTDGQLREHQGRYGTTPATLLSYGSGDTIGSTASSGSLPRGNSSVKTISPSSSQRDRLNIVIDADTKLNEYLMIYEDDSRQNIDARRFRNVMKDSSSIIRRLNVIV